MLNYSELTHTAMTAARDANRNIAVPADWKEPILAQYDKVCCEISSGKTDFDDLLLTQIAEKIAQQQHNGVITNLSAAIDIKRDLADWLEIQLLKRYEELTACQLVEDHLIALGPVFDPDGSYA